MKKRIPNILLPILLLISFGLIFQLNYNYPLHADDWVYQFIFKSDPLKRVENISDIFTSQYNHYLLWGGRSIVHFIAQALLITDPLVRSLLNSLVFVCFVYIVYRISNQTKKVAPILYSIILFSLYLFLPVFPHTILWVTGSANYLWGTCIVLLFIYPFYNYYINEQKQGSPLFNIYFLLLGIIAGWTSENLSISMIFILLSFIIYLYSSKKDIPKWVIFGFIGGCIGCFIMLSAPGNILRYNTSSSLIALKDKSILEIFIFRFRYMIYIVYTNAHSIIYLVSVNMISFLIYIIVQKKQLSKKIIYSSSLFFLTAIVSFILMIGSPEFPTRATFCTAVFFIISNAIILSALNDTNKGKPIVYCICLILFAFCIPNFIKLQTEVSSFKTIMQERESIILKSKKSDKSNIEFSKKIILPYYFDWGDISTDSLDWQNQAFSHYYNIESVRLIINDKQK